MPRRCTSRTTELVAFDSDHGELADNVVEDDDASSIRGFTPVALRAHPSRQMAMMKRPYRDVLVWLASIGPPHENFRAQRAITTVIAMLAAYDRDPRLAARWEEQFANPRKNNFPFGISLRYRDILRTYLTD
jgi:hypothetical protein